MATSDRPTWRGHLRLSLVTCPVALYTATDTGGDVHFHLINPKTNNRIKMVTVDPDTGPVERRTLAKGYEVSKDEYVLLTDKDLDSVKLESTKTIDIERFVPEAGIDRIYWDNPYYLAPEGKLAQEAFAVIRTALEKAGRIAIGRIVMSSRERILALEPRGKGILAYTLRSEAEIRRPDEIFDAIADVRPDPKMVAIAEQIMAQSEGDFDPGELTDRYEAALKALIDQKLKGRRVVAAPEPEDTNVVDLMAALRASLKGKGEAAPSAGPARKRAKSAPAKPPSARRRRGAA